MKYLRHLRPDIRQTENTSGDPQVESSLKNSPTTPSSNQDSSHHQILLSPPPTWSRTLIWTLSLGTISLLGWSFLNKIEETTSLPGQLETLRSEVNVKSPDNAVISEVKASPYQDVQKGQLLFVLSSEDLDPRIDNLNNKIASLDKRHNHEVASFAIRSSQAKAQVNLNGTIVERLQYLVNQGAAQEMQLLEKKNELFQSRETLNNINEESQKALINWQIERRDAQTQLRELKGRTRQFKVTSPIAGTIQKTTIQAKGERVQQGELLAAVVPQEGLIAAVQVSSRLAAPIKPGKPAEITVDAFPSQDFGSLKGKVETISPTTAPSGDKNQNLAYIARISISPDGIPANYPVKSLRSGMGITARVVLNEKPVISLVFDFLEDMFKPMADRR